MFSATSKTDDRNGIFSSALLGWNAGDRKKLPATFVLGWAAGEPTRQCQASRFLVDTETLSLYTYDQE